MFQQRLRCKCYSKESTMKDIDLIDYSTTSTTIFRKFIHTHFDVIVSSWKRLRRCHKNQDRWYHSEFFSSDFPSIRFVISKYWFQFLTGRLLPVLVFDFSINKLTWRRKRPCASNSFLNFSILFSRASKTSKVLSHLYNSLDWYQDQALSLCTMMIWCIVNWYSCNCNWYIRLHKFRYFMASLKKNQV